MNRRDFICAASGAVAAAMLPGSVAKAAPATGCTIRVKAHTTWSVTIKASTFRGGPVAHVATAHFDDCDKGLRWVNSYINHRQWASEWQISSVVNIHAEPIRA